jgi:hypothetical protein
VEIRIAQPTWHTDESGAEASLVERLEAQVEALTNKVGRLERRQQRFTDMIRLLLQLHDRTAARLGALGIQDDESLDELNLTVGEVSRVTVSASGPARSRRAAGRRSDG